MGINKYATRSLNAQLMGRKIEGFLQRGYIVYDDDNQIVEKVSVTKADGHIELSYKVKGAPNYTFVLFNGDPKNDDGAQTPVKEFNDHFESWKAIHPNNIVKLTEAP